MLEGIFDTADVAYRRRFLLEKYPHLAEDAPVELRVVENAADEDTDERISVLDDLAQAGGPDLRENPGV